MIITPITRAALTETCRKVAEGLGPALVNIHGQPVGLALTLFGMGQRTEMSFISNVQRDELIRVLEVWLHSLKRGDVPTGLILPG